MPLKLHLDKNRSPNYRIRGVFNGIRIDKSSGTSDIDAARKALTKIEMQIECGAFREKARIVTFAQALRLYVDETKQERHLMKLLDYFGPRDITTITAQDIMRASHDICPDVSNATRNRQVYTPMVAILRMNGISLIVKRPKGAQGNRRSFFFTPEDATQLINTASEQDAEFGLFLMFLLYTGARLGEAISLTCDNLHLSEARAVFPRTKNGQPRMVYLPPQLVAGLAGHPRGLERTGKVFRFLKDRRIYDRLTRAEQASGVIIPDGVSFHAFRHTFGSWMRRYGGLDTSGLVATGAWLSRASAQVYEHADANDSAKRADLLPNVKSANSWAVSVYKQ